jgi:Cupin superfamily protein
MAAGHLSRDPADHQVGHAQPYGFHHDLAELDLFSFDRLIELASKYTAHPRDYFVCLGAPEPGVDFYSVKHGMCTPERALLHLDSDGFRILLKRSEKHDDRYRGLFEEIVEQITRIRGNSSQERILRKESTILVNSPNTITPFHFDPEAGYFCQVKGEKRYHLYSPTVVREAELERFYVGGVVSVAQLGIENRDPTREYVFELGPGNGLYQPQNAPHWVETGQYPSISYTVVIETEGQRALGRVRACNCYLRRLGMAPTSPGTRPLVDAFKAGAMRLALPLRQNAREVLRKVHPIPAR